MEETRKWSRMGHYQVLEEENMESKDNEKDEERTIRMRRERCEESVEIPETGGKKLKKGVG